MRFLIFIFFVSFFSCRNPEVAKQEEPKSELSILSEAISRTPKDTDLLEKRAAWFLNNNNLESALMDYKECVKLAAKNREFGVRYLVGF